MKIPKYTYSLLMAGLLLSSPLHASDLMAIYREALESDAQYSAARAAFQAAQEKLPQGRAGFLPNITFTGNQRKQLIQSGVNPERAIDAQALTVTATQPIYRKENFAIYEQAKLQVLQANSQFVLASQDLILRVSQAYFDVLTAQVNIEVAEAQKKAIGLQLAQAKRNFEVGTATIVDTYEAQARSDMTTSQEIAARNELELRKRTLQQIIGRFPDKLARANENSSDLLTLKYASMDEWVSVAEENNLPLKIQQAAHGIATQDIERARAGHYPTLDLVALYSAQKGIGAAIVGQGFDITTKEIGLQFAVPVFQGGAVQSRVREALANQERVLQNLNNARRNSAMQVSQQYLNVSSGIVQVKALKQALTSIQSQLDSTILGQKVGVRTEVDVLNVQQSFYSAKRDLARAHYSLLMAKLRLEAEAGELDEDDLTEVNTMLR
ncbi:MAG: TolC family outer membrane protein [Nitrosomonadaceae bacterium]|nr:TolC family outer membrane protein [Nitrosomonadaceae bacterium]MDW7666197.1 TolC family outer membrane protein [Nitrosomonadaceae bacterium]